MKDYIKRLGPDRRLRQEDRSSIPHQLRNRFSCLAPGLDWTRLFMSLTAGAGTRCMSLLRESPTLWLEEDVHRSSPAVRRPGAMGSPSVGLSHNVVVRRTRETKRPKGKKKVAHGPWTHERTCPCPARGSLSFITNDFPYCSSPLH